MNKPTSLILGAGAVIAIIGVTLATLAAAVYLDNRSLRTELRELHVALARAQDESGRRETERAQTAEQLAAQRRAVESLRNELDQLKSKPAAGGWDGEVPGRGFPIKAYVGGRYAGTGWVVASPTLRTNAAGARGYEPVVLLADKERPAPAAARTNAIEVSRATHIQYNNYPYPYWGYTWPTVWVVGTNESIAPPPAPPAPAPRPQPIPQVRSPFLNTRVYLPRERPFLPPSVNTQSRPAWGLFNPSSTVGRTTGPWPPARY